VLVIPSEIAEEVLIRAETVSKTEDLIRQEIGAGEHPLAVWQKYGRF
jgi:regulator of RNase E activity RraA